MNGQALLYLNDIVHKFHRCNCQAKSSFEPSGRSVCLICNAWRIKVSAKRSDSWPSPESKTTPLLTPAPGWLDPARRTLTHRCPTTFAVEQQDLTKS